MVRPLRPAYNGNQVATVIMDEEDANKITAVGRIRIGLTLCRVQERIEIEKCYKCWDYGHKADKCSGEDRGERCRNCAQEGHMRKTCTSDSYCPLCNEAHEVGSRDCQRFKKALAAATRKGYRNQNSV